MTTIAVPDRNEAADYYFTYIDRVTRGDILQTLESQFAEALGVFQGISEDQSLRRYAQDKWSIRQVLNHINDAERLFVFRALWFGRGLETALPSFEQDIAVSTSGADDRPWNSHIEEFRAIRASTIPFFRHLPAEAWGRVGVASGYRFTVRAIAYIVAGHLSHHLDILQTRYQNVL